MTPKQLAEDEESPGEGLPPTLLAILRDQSVIVPQDGAVWARLAQWNNAPCNTASAEIAHHTAPQFGIRDGGIDAADAAKHPR